MASQVALISKIYQVIKGYREGDLKRKSITKKGIKNWITQFNVSHRNLVLTELCNIFKRRYFSKRKIKAILVKMIVEISDDLGFRSPKAFLKHAQFIRIQNIGKSQQDLLDLLSEVLEKKFSVSLVNCGSYSSRYSIYLDDMLCTGQTLRKDLIKWGHAAFPSSRITNKIALERGRTKLVLIYLFCHMREYRKKLFDLETNYFQEKNFDPMLYCEEVIDNNFLTSKQQMILPSRSVASKKVIKYMDQVNAEVDEHIASLDFKSRKMRFFRPINFPRKELFYLSPDSRNTVEKVFLLKGIDIAMQAINRKVNIRPLGYSLPSARNFGFGALCFTYRNISNNTPLVFWYSFTSFQPLFKKRE